MNKHQIIKLAKEFENELNAGFDLWTWLPSYRAARQAHGDSCIDMMPKISDIIKEAAEFISHKLNPSPEQLANYLYCCPCGECEESCKLD